jgi:DtxR family manganese transport transcriptional regulator
MPQRPDIADPHRRTRRDHATETAEDYVEAVAEIAAETGSCRVVDLARRFGVSHVTVSRTIARLQEEGWVHTERYRPIKLTAQGKRLAKSSRERHEIVFNFLLAIGVDPSTAAIDAEGIEHHVSPQTLRRLREFAAARRPG